MFHHFHLGDQIATSVVREVVYEAGHHLFHGMSTASVVTIGVVVIGVIWLISRPRRR